MSETTVVQTGRFPRATRGVIWVVFALALTYAVLAGFFGLIGIAGAIVAGKIPVIMPMQGLLPDAADAGTAGIAFGTFATAEVSVTGLTVPALIVFAVANLAAVASAVAAAVAVAVLCRRLLSAEPFRRGLARTLTIGGGIVASGGVIAAGLTVVLTMLVAEQLNAAEGDAFWPVAGAADTGGVVIGVVMLMVGLAFEYGERLQRDTVGLV